MYTFTRKFWKTQSIKMRNEVGGWGGMESVKCQTWERRKKIQKGGDGELPQARSRLEQELKNSEKKPQPNKTHIGLPNTRGRLQRACFPWEATGWVRI